jgi:hypothetical protein
MLFFVASSLFKAQLGVGLLNRGASPVACCCWWWWVAFLRSTLRTTSAPIIYSPITWHNKRHLLVYPALFPHSPVHQIIMRERTLLLLVSLIVSSYSFYATAFVISTTLASSTSSTTRTRRTRTPNTSRRILGGGVLIAPLRVAVDTSEIKKYVLFSLVETNGGSGGGGGGDE